MTVITRLPSQSIIDGYRGVLDFYESRGQFIVRKWPRGKSVNLTPATIAVTPIFARVNRLKPLVKQVLKVAYDRYTMGGTNTWADQCVVTYFGKNRPNDDATP